MAGQLTGKLTEDLENMIKSFINNPTYKLIITELSQHGNTPLTFRNFFQRINQMDAVKDGADTSSTSFFFTNNDFVGNLDKFKTRVCHYETNRYVGVFETMITDGTMKLIPYSRIKGDKHKREIICDNSIYDCGKASATFAVKSDNRNDPTEITTYGNAFDTGPSSNNRVNYPTFKKNDTVKSIDEVILGLLGYHNSRIDYDSRYNCTHLKLYGHVYTKPQEALNKFRIGNTQKKITLNKNPTTADKAALLYVKSLGDKLIAWFYYLFCRDNRSACIFTCDMFVALYALIFDKDFVYNVNDQKKPKVTRVYYKGGDIDWENLFTEKYNEIIADYDENIGYLGEITANSSDISFDGVNGAVRYTKRFIDDLVTRLHTLKTAIDTLNTATRRDNNFKENYTELLEYKLCKFLIVNKGYVYNTYNFKGSRYNLCIKDTPFRRQEGGGKCNLYELYRSYSLTGGGRKTYDLFAAFPNIDDGDDDDINDVWRLPVYESNTPSKINNDDINLSLYNTVTEIFTTLYNTLEPAEQAKCNEYFRVNTITRSWRSFEDRYDYRDIYDTLTYHFYAHPKYDVMSIIDRIYFIFDELDIAYTNSADELLQLIVPAEVPQDASQSQLSLLDSISNNASLLNAYYFFPEETVSTTTEEAEAERRRRQQQRVRNTAALNRPRLVQGRSINDDDDNDGAGGGANTDMQRLDPDECEPPGGGANAVPQRVYRDFSLDDDDRSPFYPEAERAELKERKAEGLSKARRDFDQRAVNYLTKKYSADCADRWLTQRQTQRQTLNRGGKKKRTNKKLKSKSRNTRKNKK